MTPDSNSTTMEAAEQAAEKLWKLIGDDCPCNGTGIGKGGDGGLVLHAYLSRKYLGYLPSEVDGIPVEWKVIGVIRPMGENNDA